MKNIYFIGINGIGMSGLAKVMKEKGYEVFGVDLSKSYVTDELEALGIKIYNEHNGENVKGMDLVVMSSAIKETNPELIKAKEEKIKIIKRGELLAFLLNKEKGMAVAGTHGKTTTSSMLGTVFLSIDPTIVVGGVLPEIGSNAKTGKNDIFIAEADESDNSFLYLHPSYSIITNIEADHLENHGSLENIKKSFSRFMDQTSDKILVCADCKEIETLIEKRENIIKYSIELENVDIYAKDIRIENYLTKFDVYTDGEFFGEFELSIPGNHNVQNALPVIYLAKEFRIEKEKIKDALRNFKGAKRRYDIILNSDIRIIDDYAHHPTEIKATIQGAKTIETNEIVAIFQPHRYSRTKFLLEEFKENFDGVKKVILLPVFSAGEVNTFGVTLEDLKEKINHPNCQIIEDVSLLEKEILNNEKEITYMFMGAGNISKIAYEIAEKYEEKK